MLTIINCEHYFLAGLVRGIVYILYSKNIDRYYIGSTKDLDVRIDLHLKKKFISSYTTNADDWEVYLAFETENISIATKIECHIKRMQSRVYIENLKRYPEMIEKLLKKYKN